MLLHKKLAKEKSITYFFLKMNYKKNWF